MLLRSTTKPPISGVLTKIHISEAFPIDFVNISMLLRSNTKPPFFSIREGLTKHRFCYKGVIVPPSKLIVNNIFPPKGFVFIRGG